MKKNEREMVKLLNDNFLPIAKNEWCCKTNVRLHVLMRKHEDGEIEFDFFKKQPSNYYPEKVQICGLYTPDDIKAIITLTR